MSSNKNFINIQQAIHFTFDVENLPIDALIVRKFSSESDSILGDAEFNLELLTQSRLEEDFLLESTACLHFRWFNQDVYHRGIISKIVYQGKQKNYYRYHLKLCSLLHWLTLANHNQVFLQQDIQSVTKKIIYDYKIPQIRVTWKLSHSYKNEPIQVQYHESDWHFLNRILRQQGIAFMWQHNKDDSELILFDNIQQLPSLPGHADIPYITLSNQAREQESVWLFQPKATLLNENFELNTYDPQQPKGNLQIKVNSSVKRQQFGDRYTDYTTGKELAKRKKQSLAWQKHIFMAESDCMGFTPGLRFSLEDHPNKTYNRGYRIISVKHFGQQSTEIDDQSSDAVIDYRNVIICIPDDVAYSPEWLAAPQCAQLFTAKIVGLANDVPWLDGNGNYRARYDFDNYPSEKYQPPHPIRMLQPYNSQGAGWHYPLRDQSEVLITCIDGDLNYPVILGAVPNADSPSSVHRETFYQHNIYTKLGNRLGLIDDPKNLQVLLNTPEAFNRFHMQAKPGAHKIDLISDQGDIQIAAAKKMTRKSKADHHQDIGNNHTTTVAGNQTIVSTQHDIHHQSGNGITQQSQQSLRIASKKSDVSLTARKGITLRAAKNIQMNVKQKDIQISSKTSNVNINVANNLKIKGQQQGPITLQHKQSTLQHTTDGSTLLTAKNITIKATTINVKANNTTHNLGNSPQASGVTGGLNLTSNPPPPATKPATAPPPPANSNAGQGTTQGGENGSNEHNGNAVNLYPSVEVNIAGMTSEISKESFGYVIVANTSIEATLKVSNVKSVNPVTFNSEGFKITAKNEVVNVFSNFSFKTPETILETPPTIEIKNEHGDYEFSLQEIINTYEIKKYKGILSKEITMKKDDWIMSGELSMEMNINLNRISTSGGGIPLLAHDIDAIKHFLHSTLEGATMTTKIVEAVAAIIIIGTVVLSTAPVDAVVAIGAAVAA